MQQVVDNKQLKEVVDSAQQILLIVGKDYRLDKISSALALTHALESVNKKVFIVAENLDRSGLEKIPEASDIKENVEPRSLHISINYGPTTVEKINYENREGVFEVQLTPYTNTFSKDQIAFNYTGLNYDLIITIGAKSLENLGTVTQQYKDDLQNKLLVNVDNDKNNTMFGKFNLVDTSAETTSQPVYDLIKGLDITCTPSTATLLLTGVMEKTKTLKEEVSPRLLRFSALLLDKEADWKRAMAAAADFVTEEKPIDEPIEQPIPLQPASEELSEVPLPEEETYEPIAPLAQTTKPESKDETATDTTEADLDSIL